VKSCLPHERSCHSSRIGKLDQSDASRISDDASWGDGHRDGRVTKDFSECRGGGGLDPARKNPCAETAGKCLTPAAVPDRCRGVNDTPPPLIDAAARPLGDDVEMRLATRQLLAPGMDPEPRGREAILRRWERADGRRFPALWKAVCIAIALGVSAVLWGIHGMEILRIFGFSRSLTMFGEAPGFYQWIEPPPRAGLTESERHLLGGNGLSHLENARRLWQGEPENPAWFARYATILNSEQNRLPDDFLETARRLDPENAWFIYQAAGRLATDALTPATRLPGEKDKRRMWEVTDEEKYQESLALFREAARLPEFESHEMANMLEIQRIAPNDTPFDQMRMIAALAGETTGVISISKVADLAVAEAQRLEKAGDASGFTAHLGDCEAFVRALDKPGDSTLIYELVHIMIAGKLAAELDASARVLLPDARAEPWATWNEKLTARSEAKKAGFDNSHLPDTTRHEGMLARLTVPMVARQVEHAPPMSLADFEPTREMEHSMFARASTLAASLIVAVLLSLALAARLRHRRLIRKLAARMELLLRPADWAWILGLGVIFPCLYVTWITHFRPMSLRQFGVHYFGPRMPFYPYALMVLLSLNGAIAAATWRVRHRLAAFSPAPSVLWRAWAARFLAGLVLPWIPGAAVHVEMLRNFSSGLSRFAGDDLSVQDVLMAMWAALFLLLLVSGIFSAGKNTLVQATVTRTLPAALAVAALVMASMLPYHRAMEIHHMRRDTLVLPNLEFPGMNPYETKVARQLRKEIRTTLGTAAD
jgi:hypothetical protein